MKLELSIWERQMLVNVVGQVRGPVVVIRQAGKALDVLELSPDEQKEIGFRVLPGGNQAWNDIEQAYELEIKDKEAANLVRRAFDTFEGWAAIDRHKIAALTDKVHFKEKEKDVKESKL